MVETLEMATGEASVNQDEIWWNDLISSIAGAFIDYCWIGKLPSNYVTSLSMGPHPVREGNGKSTQRGAGFGWGKKYLRSLEGATLALLPSWSLTGNTPEKLPAPNRKGSSSNHQLSGAIMLNVEGVNICCLLCSIVEKMTIGFRSFENKSWKVAMLDPCKMNQHDIFHNINIQSCFMCFMYNAKNYWTVLPSLFFLLRATGTLWEESPPPPLTLPRHEGLKPDLF